jgi:hypothetical protein
MAKRFAEDSDVHLQWARQHQDRALLQQPGYGHDVRWASWQTHDAMAARPLQASGRAFHLVDALPHHG